MKKRIFAGLALIALAASMVFVLTGCGGNDNPPPAHQAGPAPAQGAPAQSAPAQDAPAQTEQPEPAAPAATASPLIGTWSVNMDADIGYGWFNYTFTNIFWQDGTGREEISSGDWSVTDTFNWSASNGQLTITYTEGGVSLTATGSYSIAGNALTIYMDGVSITYHRVN